MRSLIIINIVNAMLLIPITIMYFVLDAPNVFLPVYAVWFIYVLIINRHLVKSDNALAKMKAADKYRRFTEQTSKIEQAANSVLFYKPIFEKYEEDNSIRRTYQLLADKSDRNVLKATRWLSSYNHIAGQPVQYIQTLAEDSVYIINKLNELNELVLQVEDSATKVDISYVDDMLQALKEIVCDD